MEARACRQLRDRPGAGVATADRHDRIQPRLQRLLVQRRGERVQACRIDLDGRFQMTRAGAGHDHSDVDELFAFHPRHHADDRIVIRVQRGHGWPPARTPHALSGGARDS
ncbi:hypothetical protein G6F40_017069 [Rhizopus arrhizus]|nr:hypothetical protein G6F40_017069 [Rhizopus arrhizus]